eukprot:c4288_g1_i2.p1 GENE.c4288_g1_i2~~c4288_g1_i2.p1  ORF type:complete len:450 (-),score=99.08 c4288_g1_i2:32-1222(-)
MQTSRGIPISNRNVTAVDDLVTLAINEKIDLVMVGPEVPLVEGVTDAMTSAGIACFGPTRAAAQLEASKAFSKDFMIRHNIPTATHRSFTKFEEAVEYVQSVSHRLVVKASGLAAGKGVIIPETKEATIDAVKAVLVEREFGEAGAEVVVEEFLDGEEVSCLAFTDGTTVVAMPPAQDHKRVFDGDQGPNTGGMGAYAPAPVLTQELANIVMTDVLQRTVDGMKAEGFEYKGVLYAGIMITKQGEVKVLEFNCRFGDPETQVILPLLESDLTEVLLACVRGTLQPDLVKWKTECAATVVLASEGYPGLYPKDRKISGLDVDADGVWVFHAGTKKSGANILTNGGRVLAVTSTAANLQEAVNQCYSRIANIQFEGMHFRTDIAHRALSSHAKRQKCQ